MFEYCPQGKVWLDGEASFTNHPFLRKQEEFVNGLFALYWHGVTDIIAVGHNKLPAAAEFTPLKVGRGWRVGDRYHG